jgi:hypothetical protein
VRGGYILGGAIDGTARRKQLDAEHRSGIDDITIGLLLHMEQCGSDLVENALARFRVGCIFTTVNHSGVYWRGAGRMQEISRPDDYVIPSNIAKR